MYAARLIIQGHYVQAVSSVPALRAMLCAQDSAVSDAASYFDLLGARARGALTTLQDQLPAGTRGPKHSPLAVLLSGVACVQLFQARNITG